MSLVCLGEKWMFTCSIMKKIDLFHLLSVINKEESDYVCIEARHLNRLHQKLLKYRIRGDFSRNSLERIEYDYPNYIEVENTKVIVRNISSFKSMVYCNINNIDKKITETVEEQWQLILKEF